MKDRKFIKCTQEAIEAIGRVLKAQDREIEALGNLVQAQSAHIEVLEASLNRVSRLVELIGAVDLSVPSPIAPQIETEAVQ